MLWNNLSYLRKLWNFQRFTFPTKHILKMKIFHNLYCKGKQISAFWWATIIQRRESDRSQNCCFVKICSPCTCLNILLGNVKFFYRVWVYGNNESCFRQVIIIPLCSKGRLLEKKFKNFSRDLQQKVIKTIPVFSWDN